jgi:predicted dehydrogenase
VTRLQFEFDGRKAELPEPVAGGDELVVDVISVREVTAPSHAPDSRFDFANPVRKLLFFVWREGIALTWAKVRSVRLQRRLEAAAALVVVVGQSADGQRCLCFGRQATPTLDKMVFPVQLCARLQGDDRSDEVAANEVARELGASPGLYVEVSGYSIHSGAAVPNRAAELIRLHGSAPSQGRSVQNRTEVVARAGAAGAYSLTLLGCGAYPMAYTIPALRRARRRCVVDLNPCIAAEAARRFQFHSADTDCGRAIGSLRIDSNNAVVVATYHSTHAELVHRVFAADPNAKVLVEKPPVTLLDEAYDLASAIERGCFLEIGYNRRYAALTREAMRALAEVDGPTTMTCLVKELRIPDSHWYYWPNQGTRVTGNLSHWFDLATLFIRSNPVDVHAAGQTLGDGDEVSATIVYADGSMCVIVASDRGSGLKGVQEWIEIRRAQTTVRINDFVELTVTDAAGERVTRTRIRDKGHARMYREFERAVLTDGRPQYPVQDLLVSTLLYTTVTDMLRRGHPHRNLPTSELRAAACEQGASCSA